MIPSLRSTIELAFKLNKTDEDQFSLSMVEKRREKVYPAEIDDSQTEGVYEFKISICECNPEFDPPSVEVA